MRGRRFSAVSCDPGSFGRDQVLRQVLPTFSIAQGQFSFLRRGQPPLRPPLVRGEGREARSAQRTLRRIRTTANQDYGGSGPRRIRTIRGRGSKAQDEQEQTQRWRASANRREVASSAFRAVGVAARPRRLQPSRAFGQRAPAARISTDPGRSCRRRGSRSCDGSRREAAGAEGRDGG